MTFRRFLRSSDSPHILPLKATDGRHGSYYFPRRCTRLAFFFILSVAAFLCLFLYRFHRHFGLSLAGDDDADHALPPLYEAYHDYERRLPQHDLSLPFPEGRDAKFFWVPNHVTGEHHFFLHLASFSDPWDRGSSASGWGNVMQELILNAMLAYETNRA